MSHLPIDVMDDIECLKEQLYKTIPNMTLWYDVLRSIVLISGAEKAILTLRDKKDADLYFPKDVRVELQSPMFFGFSGKEIDEYIHHYQDIDPWTEVEANNPPIFPYALSTFVDREELIKTGFIEWLEPQGINDCAVLSVHTSRDHWVALNVFYDIEKPDIKRRVLDLLSAFQPLMAGVWEAGQQFRAKCATPDSLKYFIEQLCHPALIVNRHSEVIDRNREAESLLGSSEELISTQNNKFWLTNSTLRGLLYRANENIGSREFLPSSPPKEVIYHDKKRYTITLLESGEDILGEDKALRLISIENDTCLSPMYL
ncbi:hypothetical protein LRP49_04655 [Enterovibrio sp. ZSDZ35]|uniref:PAS domain-containing protein n=1 Tax=Enterovibrio qingdaonensis TaxID=2899818 RepID=A0ABT5QHM5_9GAMM|nr:hypothetical protein [Enterovibrio sp. ZSDZ35]MDD1780486.1 hypothetical protein [Enterovibrio sp. ZSDZ35]